MGSHPAMPCSSIFPFPYYLRRAAAAATVIVLVKKYCTNFTIYYFWKWTYFRFHLWVFTQRFEQIDKFYIWSFGKNRRDRKKNDVKHPWLEGERGLVPTELNSWDWYEYNAGWSDTKNTKCILEAGKYVEKHSKTMALLRWELCERYSPSPSPVRLSLEYLILCVTSSSS